MDINELIETVTLMRSAQALYFRTREKSYLILSKKLELKVDTMISQYRAEKLAGRPVLPELPHEEKSAQL
jgi:hypothetical protein